MDVHQWNRGYGYFSIISSFRVLKILVNLSLNVLIKKVLIKKRVYSKRASGIIGLFLKTAQYIKRNQDNI